ncbi:metallophosphoesterase [Rhodoferax ferrireducens]|uniref:metallophosphoesterase n=1 Tax=Rhodoferax ferrireducens TaxID=192843 RepID=UPI0022B83BEC|nr:metallophosphoesterase [Rhodoferax ferrireducens]
MRILHLSDIHFQTPICLTPDMDPDEAFRVRLEEDLAELCNDGMSVDIILVGGDIAYKAEPGEYEAAKKWLLRLAEICRCHQSRILTVPGNHDVDWDICAQVPVSNAQEAIAGKAEFHERDRELNRQLGHAASARALFQPMEAYNEFAAQFQCNVFPERPFWQQTFELEQRVKLRVFGLTSALLSGGGGRDKAPGKLFLGSRQTVLKPDADVVALVLCHHPPSWFSDASNAGNLIDARAMLQFFGHEHDQRCIRPPEYMRFHAGAVNPERDAPAWKPGYNLVDLCVKGEGAARELKVEAHLRQFQSAPNELFLPYFTKKKEDVWTHTISIPQALRTTSSIGAGPPLPHPAQNETKITAAVQAVLAAVVHEYDDHHPKPDMQPEFKVSEPSTDNLIFRFWQLRVDEMRDIALDLGLITEADLDLQPPQRYFKAMEVAKEKGLLVELARLIEKREKNI